MNIQYRIFNVRCPREGNLALWVFTSSLDIPCWTLDIHLFTTVGEGPDARCATREAGHFFAPRSTPHVLTPAGEAEASPADARSKWRNYFRFLCAPPDGEGGGGGGALRVPPEEGAGAEGLLGIYLGALEGAERCGAGA